MSWLQREELVTLQGIGEKITIWYKEQNRTFKKGSACRNLYISVFYLRLEIGNKYCFHLDQSFSTRGDFAPYGHLTMSGDIWTGEILLKFSVWKPISYYLQDSLYNEGFSGGSVVKNMPASEGDIGLFPGLGRSPGEGNGNPL